MSMALTTCDTELFRRTIGHFATGVTVITTRHGGSNHGMTASAVTSLSLSPPMLVVCINRRAPTHDAVSSSDSFVVNVLARNQEQLAHQFSQPAADKFAGVGVQAGVLDLPLLSGCLANFECRVTDRTTGGTHTIFLAEVVAAVAYAQRQPLLYYCGRFGRLALPDDLVTSAEAPPVNGWSSEWFRLG
jgi:flavin reductase (DIM6/NTAB) family NADH-FMN oxidoreductase RutF